MAPEGKLEVTTSGRVPDPVVKLVWNCLENLIGIKYYNFCVFRFSCKRYFYISGIIHYMIRIIDYNGV